MNKVALFVSVVLVGAGGFFAKEVAWQVNTPGHIGDTPAYRKAIGDTAASNGKK